MSNNHLNNFLNREKLEKKKLAEKFFLGAFLALKQLRALRVGILRLLAAQLTNCELDHENNGDEEKFQDRRFVGSFTKGLPHNVTTGQVDPEQFKRFRVATHKGDFFSDEELQLGKNSFPAVKVDGDKPVRAWESPAAGLTFEMHGPDSHSVTMPPAPELGSDQLTFEMAEVYWLALLRDTHFKNFQDGCEEQLFSEAVEHLNGLLGIPTPNWGRRNRRLVDQKLTAQTIFRGTTDGDLIGPYLSQFLLIGSPGHENNQENVTNGLIGYGALKIDQKLVPARLGLDHMTTWNVFIDVQDGANVGGTDVFKKDDSEEFLAKRFITYPRDLATYVHFDALYEAYLNACLILLDFDAPVDSGIAQLNSSISPEAKKASASGLGRVDGFALFGGPHILNLVTEVATRALKAVRYQKFNVHCRLRPEALAGWMEAINRDVDAIKAIDELTATYNILNSSQDGINLLDKIKEHNGNQNKEDLNNLRSYLISKEEGDPTALLPMAFPEGSPMHPAYGAGHATVAGACVTMLKAFFDTDAMLVLERVCDGDESERTKKEFKIIKAEKYDKKKHTPVAYRPSDDGMCLENTYQEVAANPLTVGNELNKIAANISIGRNMAGV
ncbi:MAG: hypothetical protein AB4372_07725, partial [Xenococcus sp. (in: cyanobacteria)]